jgi:7-carboxy-7-deazaguanine synthase
MSYAVNEIFYSLCGEGANTGRPAVFLRFAGCNLGYAVCPWCDTDWVGTDGTLGGRYELDALCKAVADLWPESALERPNGFVVLTGGEPLLQADGYLIASLHTLGFRLAIETNGMLPLPISVDARDWITVSPKAGARLKLAKADELKLVYPQHGLEPSDFDAFECRHRFLQPMDGPDVERNTALAVGYVLGHPWWRLSAQMHKRWGLK